MQYIIYSLERGRQKYGEIKVKSKKKILALSGGGSLKTHLHLNGRRDRFGGYCTKLDAPRL